MALALAVFLDPGNHCSATGFEAKGQLLFQIGTNQPLRSKICVQVDSCSWAIRVSDDPYFPFLEESVISSDGTNLFQIDVFKPKLSATNHGGVKNQPVQTVNWIANVRTGNVPDYDYHHNSHLWFAFGSQCYLRQTTTDRLPCILMRPRNSADCTVKATWTPHPKADGILAAAVFDEGKIEMLNGEVMDRPPPFDRGFTNLVYHVQAFTNIGASFVPLRFSFEMFRPRENALSSADIITEWRLEGIVESVRDGPGNVAPPQILARTRVEDFRSADFSNVKSVVYYTTNAWLTTNHPAFIRLISGVAYDPEHKSAGKYVIGAMMLTSLLFLGFLLKHSIQSKQRKEHE